MKKIIIILFLLFSILAESNAQCNMSVLFSFDPTCGASNNGGISVTTTGTFGTVNYTLMPGNVTNTTGSFTNLSAGSYTITSIDSLMCSNSTSVTLNTPVPVSITGLSYVGLCPFTAGNTTVHATGGSGNYTLNTVPVIWTNGNRAQLQGGTTYTITLVDAQGCTASTVYTTGPAPPWQGGSITSNNSGCALVNGNGSVCYTAAGGVPPYSISLLQNFLPIATNATGCFNNLTYGQYSLEISDNLGCVWIDTNAFSINNNNPNVSSFTHTLPSGCNASDGDICVLNVTSGIPPLQYSINNGPTQASNCFTNLSAGTYTISVTDANNCTGTGTYTLPNAFLNFNLTNTPPSCGQSNGQICAVTTQGQAPFQYSINSGPNQLTNCFTGLNAGSYTITVTDASSCVRTQTFNLADQNILNSPTGTPSVCGGPGSINVSANALAAPPVSFQLMPGNIVNNTGSFGGLSSGPYVITATDANNCSSTKNAYVSPTDNSGLSPIITNAGGTITINAPAGLTPPLLYRINGSAWQASNIFPGNGPGWKGCYVKETSGCYAYGTIVLPATVTSYGLINGYSYHDNNANCVKDIGENNLAGMQIITAPGGLVTYTNPAGYYSFTNVPMGSYTVFQNPNQFMDPSNCGNYFPFTFLPANTFNTFDFANTLYNNSQDMRPVMWTNTNFSPGFTTTIKLKAHKGNPHLSSNGQIIVELDPNVTYLNATPAPISIVGNTYTWNYANSNIIYINVNTPVATMLNTPINHRAITTLTSSIDNNPLNDTSYIQTVVLGAYDPNNKLVEPYGFDAGHNIDKNDSILTYTVNFQNVGNAPAQNVVVIDTLSDKLEIFKFEMLYASHDYKINIINNKVLQVTFENIQLPDSVNNEPDSHGQFVYQIHQKGNNNYGDVIKNKAEIYFDFNPPIVTNEVFNTIYQKPNSIYNISKEEFDFLLQPVPANNIININCTDNIDGTAKILGISGKVLATYELNRTSHKQIDISQFSGGLYFMLIESEKMRGLKKFVIE